MKLKCHYSSPAHQVLVFIFYLSESLKVNNLYQLKKEKGFIYRSMYI